MKLSTLLFAFELEFKKMVAVRFIIQDKGCEVKVYSNYNPTECEFWCNSINPTEKDAQWYVEKYQQIVK